MRMQATSSNSITCVPGSNGTASWTASSHRNKPQTSTVIPGAHTTPELCGFWQNARHCRNISETKKGVIAWQHLWQSLMCGKIW